MQHHLRLRPTAWTHDGFMRAVRWSASRRQALLAPPLALLLCAPAAAWAQSQRRAGRGPAETTVRRPPSAKAVKPAPLASRLKQCAQQPVCLRLLAEYGAVLGADTDRATVPSGYIFRNEAEVQRFQSRAGSASEGHCCKNRPGRYNSHFSSAVTPQELYL